MDLVEINKAFLKLKPKPKMYGTPRPAGDPGAWMRPSPVTVEGRVSAMNSKRIASESASARELAQSAAPHRLVDAELKRLRSAAPHEKLPRRTPTNAGAFPWNG